MRTYAESMLFYIESVIELGNAVEAKYAIGAARSEILANFFLSGYLENCLLYESWSKSYENNIENKIFEFFTSLNLKENNFFPLC